VTFIQPPWVFPGHDDWEDFCETCSLMEQFYNAWRGKEWKPQQARYFLPNGIKTEYVATHNLGSWFNFFKKRTSPAAHPQIRQLAVPLLRYFQEKLPFIYEGMELPELDYSEAKLIEHFGVEPLDNIFQEVYTDR
jgi:thymidylate synthase (FAD)